MLPVGENNDRLGMTYKLLQDFSNSCHQWEQAVPLRACPAGTDKLFQLVIFGIRGPEKSPPTSGKTLPLKPINLHLELVIPLVKRCSNLVKKRKNYLV